MKIAKKRGRKRVCFTYEEAKQIVRVEGVSSKTEYKKWWAYNIPARMPKYPDRAYKNCNFTWADFLGVKNLFPKPRAKFCSYDDARKYAHTLNLSNRTEWVKFAARSGKKPINIPTRPDIVYQKKREWISWKHFLGSNIIDKQKVLVEASRAILYVVKLPNSPGNVYKINSGIDNIEKLKELQLANKIRIVKLFYLNSINENWISLIEDYCNNYFYGTNDEYVVYNIAELIDILSDKFETILL